MRGDHATGAVRGVLCFNCNQALGHVRDDVMVLRRLIMYVMRSWVRALQEVRHDDCCVVQVDFTGHAA